MSQSSAASKPSSENSNSQPKFFRWFDRYFVPPMRRFGETPAMSAIREALPWSLIGLAAGILLFFAASFQSDPGTTFLKRYASSLLPGFGLMSVTLCAILPYKLSQRFALNPWILVPAALIAFFLSPPSGTIVDLRSYLATVGASGLFLAMIVSLLAGYLCQALRTLMPKASVVAQLAGGVALFGAALFCFGHHLSLSDAVLALLRPLGFLGDTYLALLLITVIETLLWTAGVHGPALLAGIVTPVYLFLQQQNTVAFDHHVALPHIVVVSLFLFVFPGGAGATLPLAIMLRFSRVARLRKIGTLTLVPSLFNINEPLLFGLPIVLNPFLVVPFVLAPSVLATITYLAVRFDLVGRPAFYYPSSIPSVISTYLATLDWRAVALIVLNIAIAAAIYFPFFRAYERHEATR